MSSALLGKLDDLQNLSWEASEWTHGEEWKDHNESFESTELDSDAQLLLSMSSKATSVQLTPGTPKKKVQSAASSVSLRPLPTSRRALSSGLDSLQTMLECIEGLAEQDMLAIQACLEDTVNTLKNSPAWGTTVFRSNDLFPYSNDRPRRSQEKNQR